MRQENTEPNSTRGLDLPVLRHLAQHRPCEQRRRQLAELRHLPLATGLDDQRSTEYNETAVEQPPPPIRC
jgi:hypothetical protein